MKCQTHHIQTVGNNIEMKKIFLKTIILTLSLIVISLLLVYILTLPAIWNVFDLTNTSSIGETVGGITSPLLGIISVIFLYLTLNKQIDSNEDQKLKNDCDIIFMLFNQLDNEYNQIYQYSIKGEIRTRKNGHEALTDYCNSVFKYHSGNKKWSTYYMSHSIILVIRSMKLIKNRINYSSINNEMKDVFLNKLNTYYLCKMKDPLFKLSDSFKREECLRDEYTQELTEFYESMEKLKIL